MWEAFINVLRSRIGKPDDPAGTFTTGTVFGKLNAQFNFHAFYSGSATFVPPFLDGLYYLFASAGSGGNALSTSAMNGNDTSIGRIILKGGIGGNASSSQPINQSPQFDEFSGGGFWDGTGSNTFSAQTATAGQFQLGGFNKLGILDQNYGCAFSQSGRYCGGAGASISNFPIFTNQNIPIVVGTGGNGQGSGSANGTPGVVVFVWPLENNIP